jgi:hypothetical protein
MDPWRKGQLDAMVVITHAAYRCIVGWTMVDGKWLYPRGMLSSAINHLLTSERHSSAKTLHGSKKLLDSL